MPASTKAARITRAPSTPRNKNIVYAERLLNQITGKKFHAYLWSLRMIEPQVEKQRHGNPRRALQQCLAQADDMVFTMEHAEINQQGRSRRDGKDCPDVYRRSQHGVFAPASNARQRPTSLTGQSPRTKTDIAHFHHIVVAGFARMHDNSPL